MRTGADWLFPDYQEPDQGLFPITPILILDVSGLTHRDILGAVLGLGMKREMIGDIFVDDDRAVLMCDSQVSDFVLYNLETVGRRKVDVSVCPQELAFSQEHKSELMRTVIASERLDAVVSAATGLSRNEAATCIAGGNVSVNFVSAEDGAKNYTKGIPSLFVIMVGLCWKPFAAQPEKDDLQ